MRREVTERRFSISGVESPGANGLERRLEIKEPRQPYGGRRKVPALHAKSSVSPYSARSGEQNDLIGMLPPVANCKETH